MAAVILAEPSKRRHYFEAAAALRKEADVRDIWVDDCNRFAAMG